MSDWVIRQIRTYVPLAIGAFLTWAARRTGFAGFEDLATELIPAVVAVVSAVYYFVVSWAAEKFPSVGVLLGYNVKPKYNDASPETTYNALGHESG
jgi:hypothetical protein